MQALCFVRFTYPTRTVNHEVCHAAMDFGGCEDRDDIHGQTPKTYRRANTESCASKVACRIPEM